MLRHGEVLHLAAAAHGVDPRWKLRPLQVHLSVEFQDFAQLLLHVFVADDMITGTASSPRRQIIRLRHVVAIVDPRIYHQTLQSRIGILLECPLIAQGSWRVTLLGDVEILADEATQGIPHHAEGGAVGIILCQLFIHSGDSAKRCKL